MIRGVLLGIMLLLVPELAEAQSGVYINNKPATTTTLGGVIVGSGLNVTTSGVVNVAPLSTLSLSGNLTVSGASSLAGTTVSDLTITGTCSGCGAGTINSGTQYRLAYYPSTGTTISGNAGIFTDASNNLFATGALVVNGSTFDGFNTKLQVNQSGVNPYSMDIHGTSTTSKRANILFSNFVGSANGKSFEFGVDATQTGLNDFFIFDDIALLTRFYIGPTGNVGVGTTTVPSRLTVAGAVGLSATATVPANGMYLSGTNTLALSTNSTKAVEISSAQLVSLPAITTDATHTDATLCEDTTTHAIYFGSGTAGICLGTSSARYKHDIVPLADGAAKLRELRPVSFYYNKGRGDNGAKVNFGFLAEDMVEPLPELVGLDTKGEPNSVDLVGLIPILVKAMQEQQQEIDDLRRAQQ